MRVYWNVNKMQSNNNQIWFKTENISLLTSEEPNMVVCGVSEGSFKFPLKISNVRPKHISFGTICKKIKAYVIFKVAKRT